MCLHTCICTSIICHSVPIIHISVSKYIKFWHRHIDLSITSSPSNPSCLIFYNSGVAGSAGYNNNQNQLFRPMASWKLRSSSGTTRFSQVVKSASTSEKQLPNWEAEDLPSGGEEEEESEDEDEL